MESLRRITRALEVFATEPRGLGRSGIYFPLRPLMDFALTPPRSDRSNGGMARSTCAVPGKLPPTKYAADGTAWLGTYAVAGLVSGSALGRGYLEGKG